MGKFLLCCLTLTFYAYLDSVLRDKQFYTPIDHIQPEPDHLVSMKQTPHQFFSSIHVQNHVKSTNMLLKNSTTNTFRVIRL